MGSREWVDRGCSAVGGGQAVGRREKSGRQSLDRTVMSNQTLRPGQQEAVLLPPAQT